MLDSVKIANVATFDTSPTIMEGLSQFNFVYGANGSGKTTLSRVIADCGKFSDCSLTWSSGLPLETVVYNRDFVAANFYECEELPGIFTLGEKHAETIKKIEFAKKDLHELVDKMQGLKVRLQGNDGRGGKLGEKAFLDDSFNDACWAQKKKYETKFKGAFEGVRGSIEKFKARVLQESNSNSAVLNDIAELEKRAETVFSTAPKQAEAIQTVDFSTIIQYEDDPILVKRVVGKADVDISSLIMRLRNSDWVREGRAFYDDSAPTCPFCQQQITSSFEQSLNSFFDDAFENDSLAIKTLEDRYQAEASRIREILKQLVAAKSPFLNTAKLLVLNEQIDAEMRLNLRIIETKSKELSRVVVLSSLKNVCDSINTIIDDANIKVQSHNLTVRNIENEKKLLTAEVWRYLLDVELKDNLTNYVEKTSNINTAIQSLRQKIDNYKGLIATKNQEIADLEKLSTSIQPAVDGINSI